MSFLRLGIFLLFTHAVGTVAHAQVVDYLQEMKYPSELPAPGTMVPVRSTYYLKMPNPFGVDVLPAEQAKLKMPEGKAQAAVWVDFKSAVLTTAINEQLKLRGIRLAESQEAAELVLRGEVSYYSANHPYTGRRLVLDQRLDSANLLEGGTPDSTKTVARSAWDLAPAYKFRGADPVTFGVGVFSALFDATGLTSALANARNDDEKMKNESYMMVDCFDKDTRRASACPSEAQRLESYRRKIRLQTVAMKAYLGAPGASNNDSQRVYIVTRQIDSRSATAVSLPELLGTSVSELVSGLGQVQAGKE
jgi:hypothetical protein